MNFTNKVAIITGAGDGLGRSYALELGRLGARVLVNGRVPQAGAPSKAELVAEAIRAAGGQAIAFEGDVASYECMEAMANVALEQWGRIDILINNAGIEVRCPFGDTAIESLQQVISVNLMGTINATRAVWGPMRDQRYGRILMSTSAVGLWGGNHGQSGYGASKLGAVGLAGTLRIEGAQYDIRVNSLIPAAHTQMSEGVLPADLRDVFSAERVVPGALALVSDDAPSGAILGAGVGLFHGAWITMNEGAVLGPSEWTAEAVLANWDRITDRSTEFTPVTGADEAKLFMAAIKA